MTTVFRSCVMGAISLSQDRVVEMGEAVKSFKQQRMPASQPQLTSIVRQTQQRASQQRGWCSVWDVMWFAWSSTWIWADASSAKSVASGRGLGKQGNAQTCYLWIQDVSAANSFATRKTSTASNVSDI